ncbi:MAG: hypothetical protein IT201_00320 [Thermoleophilia bacterium]|nr:hypothetical protein [Thermoleophilia bacterium]
MPSVGETGRALRDRPLGKALILAVTLLAAVLVARSCARADLDVSKDEAIAIATGAVEFEPDVVQVRIIKRGLQSDAFWAVSLSTRRPDDSLANVTVVVIDARSGEIAEIRVSGA